MNWLLRLREARTLAGLGCVLLICVAALDNLAFTDQLMGTTYHRVQLIWFVIGLISAGLVAALDLSYLRRLGPTMYAVLVVLLGAVLVVGREINYSKRWIELGPVNVQPSEFMKLAVILQLADWFDQRRATQPWRLRDLFKPAMIMAIPVILINLEPDLGTSLCVLAIAAGMILYEGVVGRGLVIAAIGLLLTFTVAWETGIIRDYQKGRAEAWYQSMLEDDERQKPPSERTQAEQALWAVGSGRWTGRSDAEAKASVLRHLPFMHTDFALAPFAARFGLLGCMALFLCYAGVVGWALRLADRVHERFDALVAVGVAGLIFWQFFVNAGMVIGLLPVVGVTLPLFSYGGSSALTSFLGIGLLLNMSARRGSQRSGGWNP